MHLVAGNSLWRAEEEKERNISVRKHGSLSLRVGGDHTKKITHLESSGGVKGHSSQQLVMIVLTLPTTTHGAGICYIH